MAGNGLPAKRPREGNHNEDDGTVKHIRPNHSMTLVVFVGQFEQVFIVHKDKLTMKSKLFRAACSRNWTERATDTVRLPEVELDTFQMYTDWVYSDTIVLPEPSTTALIKLYLLGDFLDDVRLRNATMRLLVASVHTYKTSPRVVSIKSIWNNTAPNSLLRSWIVDVAARYHDKATFAEHAVTFPAEFVLQVALKLLPVQHVGVTGSFLRQVSKYLEVEEVD